MKIPKILIVDDDANLRKSLSDILAVKGCETLTAGNGEEAFSALEAYLPDLVLVDLLLPDMSGIDVLDRVKSINPCVETIILTGHAEVESAIEATNKGAFSFIQKPCDIEQLLINIKRASEKKSAKEALESSEARYRQLFEQAKDGIMTVNAEDGAIRDVNSCLLEMTGYSRGELEGRRLWDVSFFQDPDEVRRGFGELFSKGCIRHENLVLETKDKGLLDVRVVCTLCSIGSGKIAQYSISDVTERKALEAQLAHAHKMEALGTLTGGIAHDFNNVLTVITAYTELLLIDERTKSVRGSLEKVAHAADRAKDLVQSLLAYSRKQIIEPKPMCVNAVIRKMASFLANLLGEDIELSIDLKGEELVIMADAGRIEQVLMNLASNARDAMPDVGAFSISTNTIELNEEFIKRHGYGRTGKYVLIKVSDTGCGMDEKTRKRIYEPFFTTKEVGKGTGLGLSLAFGTVKQHGGYITCGSEIGRGTTFKIYFPRCEEKVPKECPSGGPSPQGGTETILLVEDNNEVRAAVQEILQDAGYEVIEAYDGIDALGKFAETGNEERIGLVILDVIMPRKNGKEVFDEIRKRRPGVKALFMSGYASDILQSKGLTGDNVDFIHKPFSPDAFLRAVGKAMGDARMQVAGAEAADFR